MKRNHSAIALLAVFAATFSGIKNVHGELVFEEDLPSSRSAAQRDSNIEIDEESLAAEETSLGSSDDDGSVPVGPAKTSRDYSRSERLRRHRMRAELKNEDKLTERLEEMRLKDEVKRVDGILGSAVKKDEAQPEGQQAALAVPSVQTQAVGQLAAQPQPAAPAAEPVVSGQSVAQADVEKKEESEDKMRVGISPRFGLNGILSSNFEISSRYAFGVGVYVDVWDHFGFEAAYTRAAYRVNGGNAFGAGYYGYYGMATQQLNMNQNVFELGPRVNILGRKSRVQPFVSVGLGYYRSSINLDQNTQNYIRMYNPMLAGDYNVSGFLGYVGGGAEFKITENIGIMGLFKYYNVFSSRESNPLSSAAFVNPSGYAGYGSAGLSTLGAAGGGDTRMQASRSMGKANFYTLQAGVSLSF